MQTLTTIAAAATTVKPHAPTTADLAPLGVTESQFKAMPAAAQAALVKAMQAVREAEAKKAPANKLAVVVYADCGQGGTNAQGIAKNCRIVTGTDKCSHGNTFKGNLAITGLGKFPLSLYAGQVVRADDAGVFAEFIAEARKIVAAGFGTK